MNRIEVLSKKQEENTITIAGYSILLMQIRWMQDEHFKLKFYIVKVTEVTATKYLNWQYQVDGL